MQEFCEARICSMSQEEEPEMKSFEYLHLNFCPNRLNRNPKL